MSRFFVQLLLSVVVGVSAAVGLGPQAIKIRQEAKASLREAVKIVFTAADDTKLKLNTNTSVSAQTQVKTSIKDDAKLDSKAKGGLDARVTTGGTVLDDLDTDLSLDGSLTANTQTIAETEAGDIGLNLKDKINSALDFSIDP
jgi:hypothetical protein